jgi:hypothetical protein
MPRSLYNFSYAPATLGIQRGREITSGDTQTIMLNIAGIEQLGTVRQLGELPVALSVSLFIKRALQSKRECPLWTLRLSVCL